MPELPDLNVFSENLNKTLKGKTIKRVDVPFSDKLNVTEASFKKSVEGQQIKKVYREGKELHFALSGDDVIGMHLMFHGSLYRYEGKNTHKNPIVQFLFDDDTGLVLTDWQHAANVTINPEVKEAPDALSDDMNYGTLKRILQSKGAIKALLLNQKKIRGIGNAYADEILWEAKISPLSISNKIPEEAIKALAKAIKKVLTDAEAQIKKTHPDIITGEVRDFLPIHNSKKKESPTGGKIESAMVGGRITYYTDEQMVYA